MKEFNYNKYIKKYSFENLKWNSKYYFDTNEKQLAILSNSWKSLIYSNYDSFEFKQKLQKDSIETIVVLEYFTPVLKETELLKKDEFSYAYIFKVTSKMIEKSNIIDLLKSNPKYQKILTANQKYSIKVFWKNLFYCLLDWTFWMSPIEYYEGWEQSLNSKEHISKGWPYDLLNKELESKFCNSWYKIYISNKEKFWQWRYEGLSIIDKDNKPISIKNLKENNPSLFYELFFFIYNFLNNYNLENPLTSYDYEKEWMNYFLD